MGHTGSEIAAEAAATRAALLATLRERRDGEDARLDAESRRQIAIIADIARLERELRAGSAAPPKPLRPVDVLEPLLAAKCLEAQEASLRARTVREAVDGNRRRVDEARATRGEVDDRYRRDVTMPLVAAIARADASLRQLDDHEASAPVPSRATSEIEGASAWAAALAAWSEAEQSAALSMRQETERARDKLAEQIGSALREAGSDDAAALVAATHASATERVILMERIEIAERAVRDAAVLRERLDAIEPLENALGHLRRYLENNRFKEYLMRRRERSLLGCATTVLRAMTGGTYAFAEGFQILDGFTQQTRDARTLSGGEKFLASLALALGLVEIAALAGGRLDALFLDEGFGSLDAAALDAALSELSERARAGKMIGVITHVGAVADAIDTVLRVRRLPGGSVVTRLVGVERDEFLADGGSGLLEAAG